MGASPSDRRNLAPVDVQENSGWLDYIRSAFLAKYPGLISDARGVGTSHDLAPLMSTGRIPINKRQTAAAANINSRGSMSAIPTPQALIKQVTGVGDTRSGR
jgi:hypothetical protein